MKRKTEENEINEAKKYETEFYIKLAKSINKVNFR